MSNSPSTESFESAMTTAMQLYEDKKIGQGAFMARMVAASKANAEQTANKRVAAGEEFGMHILAKELIARGADPRFVLGCQSAAKKHPELRMVQSTPPKPKADAGEEG